MADKNKADKIGKKETSQAHINVATKVLSTKMIIKGAIAITGVTCNIIA